jgi:hypothetical protein
VLRWMSERDSGTEELMRTIQVRGIDQEGVSALPERAARRPHRAPVGRRQRKLKLRTVSVGAPVSYSRATIYGDADR